MEKTFTLKQFKLFSHSFCIFKMIEMRFLGMCEIG